MRLSSLFACMLVPALMGADLFVSEASASSIIEDTFPADVGYSVFGYDPDDDPDDPRALRRGYAVEFRTGGTPIQLGSIDLSMNIFDGPNEFDISIHESEPYFDLIRPSLAIETFHLSGALGQETRVIHLDSVLNPVLDANASYFIAVSTTEDAAMQRLRWSVGDPSDTGFVRAPLRPNGTWGAYTFTTFPRTAFRVTAVPEPSTALLLACGLAWFSRRRAFKG